MKIRSLRNDNLLSCCVYSDILNRKFPPKKPFRPENSDCVKCATFSLPRIKFNLSSGVFERRTATGSKTSSLFLCLDATTFVLISVITLIETICLNFQGETAFLGGIFCLEYPSRRREKVNCHFLNYSCHFANYRFSFRKLLIFISQTTDCHFANYSCSAPFSFRTIQLCRSISFRSSISFRRSISFRKLQ